ncbi:insulinase family protein [Candidatus Curtissbacteria bacterium]|nr:insulinase family protein [Candidatus Curtissbacteria bacterium]
MNNTQEFEKLTLPNGLRVVLAPLTSFKSVTAIVLCGAGSRYETKQTNGISHFLEHMFFKGTHKRPSALDISHELDAIGADYNAFTGKESTAYHIKAASQHLPLLLDMLSDMLWNSKFDAKEIEKERGVIIEEINLYQDTPARRVAEIYEHVLWGDQPLGWDIGGEKDVIRKVSKQDFGDYVAARYVPSNLVLAIAGHFDHGQTINLVNKYYGKNIKGIAPPFLPVIEEQSKPQLAIQYKDTDQAHLVVGFRGLPATHPDRYNLAILGTILGGGMSSRLFVNVREKHGLAYYVRAGNDGYHDTGTLAASAGVDLKRIDDALKYILEEFVTIAHHKVTERELNKAKEYIKGGLALSWEDSRSVALGYGSDELFETRIRQLEEYIREIDAVTAEDIQRMAQFLVTESKLNLAVIGPFKDSARFEKLLKV